VTLCNKTGATISFSVAGFDSESERLQWRSKGWWNVDGGACETLGLDIFKKRHLFVYGEGGGGRWQGEYVFCVHPTDGFDLIGDSDCENRDTDLGRELTARSFIHKTSPNGVYTLDFTE